MTAIANGSSSSATSRLELDLLAGKRLAPLPKAFLEGRDLDLLSPLRFLPAGELPIEKLPAGELPTGEPIQAQGRPEIAAALGKANTAWGHPRAAELAERLADPTTLVTVTGQQPGLYGGPLLTLSKMAATVRYAEALQASGKPAVPVFWVATEDHDWRELTQAALLTRQGAKSYDLGEDLDPLRPVGLRTFGPRLTEVENQIIEDLGNEAAVSRFRQITAWYQPEAGFGEAFCRLFIELLGDRAPLFLDSMDPEIKRLQSPWLKDLIKRREKIDQALTDATEQVTQRGYSPQVHYQPGTSPLFLLEGGERRRIVWEGSDGYSLRGSETSGNIDQLLKLADDEPERLSPGVLARPVIQDALLGTTLQLMGPAEISYLTQVKAVYEVLEVPAPWTTLRPQAMLLEDRQRGYLEELDISLAELLDQPLEQLLADRLGDDFVTPVREHLEATLDGLREPVLNVDASLEKPLKKTRDQIGRALEQLASKIAGAVARRNDVWLRRISQVLESCRPDGHLQERHLSIAHYLARYGPSFVEAYWEDFELDSRRLQVLRPGERGPS